MRSPFCRWQSNFGAVPPTSVIANMHSMACGWFGSESNRALSIGVSGRCHTVARDKASSRSASDTFFDFMGTLGGGASGAAAGFSPRFAAGESQPRRTPQAATITRAPRRVHPIRMARCKKRDLIHTARRSPEVGLQDRVEIVADPLCRRAFLVLGPAHHRTANDGFNGTRQLFRVRGRDQFSGVDRVANQPLQFRARGPRTSCEVRAELRIGEV